MNRIVTIHHVHMEKLDTFHIASSQNHTLDALEDKWERIQIVMHLVRNTCMVAHQIVLGSDVQKDGKENINQTVSSHQHVLQIVLVNGQTVRLCIALPILLAHFQIVDANLDTKELHLIASQRKMISVLQER